MNTETEADWLRPGAPAAIVRTSHRGASVKYVTIERVLTRDVVLDNGERFRQPSLRKDNGGPWDGVTYLRSPDDPLAVRAGQDQALRQRRSQLRSTLEDAERRTRAAKDEAALDQIARELAAALSRFAAKGS